MRPEAREGRSRGLRALLPALLAVACASPADVVAGPVATTRDEAYRPQIHFTPASGWMNDPNGLVHHRGEWHLFFQHNPARAIFGPIHWGHATSTDLVRWTPRDIAVYPDDVLGLAYSGSALVARDGVAAALCGGATECLALALTHHGGEDGTEKQSLFTSEDGRDFAPFAGNPVLPDPDPATPDFRDPKVFRHEGTGQYVMVLAAGEELTLFGSPDLVAWTPLSSLAPPGTGEGVLECPDLFPLPVDGDPARTRWVLKYDRNRAATDAGPSAYALVGDFDGTTFAPDGAGVRLVDHGADFYAAQSFSDAPDGRRLWLAWMANWSYAANVPTRAWRGAMSLPREVRLTERDGVVTLAQRPAPELDALARETLLTVSDVPLARAASRLARVHAVVARVRLEVEPRGADRVWLDLRVGEGEVTRLVHDAAAGSLALDRTASGEDAFSARFPARHEAPLALSGGRLRLDVWVDTSSVEVFADEGAVVLTDRVYPDAASDGLALGASGGDPRVVSLTVEALDGIWAP